MPSGHVAAVRRAAAGLRDGGWRPSVGRPTLVAATVALVVIVALVVVAVVTTDRSPVAVAADDLAGWPAATYRGALTDPEGETATVAVTVVERGPAYGVVERPSGARAQVVRDGDVVRTKGNRAWWRALGAPDVLAGAWVDDPTGLPALLVSGELMSPASFARRLVAGDTRSWTAAGRRPVGARDGYVLSAPDGREVVIDADDGATVLRMALPLDGDPDTAAATGIPADSRLDVVVPSDADLDRLRSYVAAALSEPDTGPVAEQAGCASAPAEGC